MKRFLLALPALCLLAAPALAQTPYDPGIFDYDGDGIQDPTANARHVEYWAPEDLPLPWVMNEAGYPGLDATQLQEAIVAGFDAWAAVPGVGFGHSFEGTVTARDGDISDGVNLVSFQDSGFSALYGNAVIAVGITTSLDAPGEYNGQPVRAGQIVDADMLFNPTRQFNFTGLAGSDVRSVATHEAGHLIGISHSSRESATMFPALPRGLAARSLTADDELAAFMAYPEAGALAGATELRGTIVDGRDGQPVPGAAMFLVSAATGDTASSTYSLPDGSYAFVGVPAGDYYLSAHPLDGSAGIKGVTPGFINAVVQATAVTLFRPESWDAAESAMDDPQARTAIALAAGSPEVRDITTNVDATAPAVSSRVPAPGATAVPVDVVVALGMDEGIDFSSTTGRFRMQRLDAAGSPVQSLAGRLNYLGREFVLIFNSQGSLGYSSDYRVTLEAGVTDLFGNATTSDVVWEFRTQDPPPAEISSVSPSRGTVGSAVTITGVGLDFNGVATPVTIGGLEAPIVGSGARSLTVLVPELDPAGDYELVVNDASGPLPAETFTLLPARGPVAGHLERRVPLGANPIELAVHPSGSFAWVATDDGVEVVAIDQSGNNYGTVAAAVAIPGGADAIALTPDGQRAYAIAREAGEIHVLDTVFDDPSLPPQGFNSTVDVLDTGGEPLGAALDLAGRRLWVSMGDGTVQGWDVDRAVLAGGTELSPTYHRQVAGIPAPAGVGLEGSLALSPTADELYVLGGAGTVRVYDTTGGHDLLGQVPTQLDPQDLAVGPTGQFAHVTHSGGSVSIVDLAARSLLQSVAVGGSPRGITAMPDGQRVFLADRLEDRAQSIGTVPGQPGFRAPEATVATGDNPVDVAPLPASDGFVVAEQGTGSLALFSTSRGPRLRSISPQFLSERGGYLNIVADPPFGQPIFDFNATFTLELADGSQYPLSWDFNRTFRALLPPGFAPGPVRMFSSLGQVRSSALPLGLAQPIPDYSGTRLSLRVGVIGAADGYDFGTSDGGDTFTQVNATSADGQLAFFATNGSNIKVMDLRPQSPTYEQVLVSIPTFGATRAMVYDPGPKKLLAAFGGSNTTNQIHQYDADLSSPTFGQYEAPVGYLAFPQTAPDVRDLFLNPAGNGTLLAPTTTGEMWWIEYLPDRDIYDFQFAQAVPGAVTGSYVNGAFSPDGHFFVSLFMNGQGGQLWALDTDPSTENFYQTLSVLPVNSTPKGIAMRPDRDSAYLFTQNIVGGEDMKIHELDLANPFSMALVDSFNVGPVASTIDGNTTLAPNLETLVHETGEQVLFFPIYPGDASILPRTPSSFIARGTLAGVWPRGAIFPADGRPGYLAPVRDPHMLKLHYNPGESVFIFVESGAGQSGQVGQRLPAPIRARVLYGDLTPKPFAVVTAEVLEGGGTLDNGTYQQVYATDGQGYISVNWTLGPGVSPPQQRLRLRELDAGIEEIVATALAEPGSVPLALVSTLPAAGATNVGLRSSVAVTFNQAVDPASVSSSTLSLRVDGSANPLPVAYGFANLGRTVSLTPASPLPASATLELAVAGLQATAGSTLSNPDTTSFTTAPPPPLALTSISPTAAAVGGTVVLSGTGFDPVATNNVVFFGSMSTRAFATRTGGLSVTVPNGATTGSVRVEARGQVSGTKAFTVLVPQTAPVEDVVASYEAGVTLNTLAVLPDGSRAYSVDTGNDALLPLDLVGFTPQAPVRVGNEPVSVVADPSGERVYTANYASGTVSVVSTTPPEQVLATIPVGEGPLDLVMHPDGDRLYVVNSQGESVDVIDIEPSSATYNTVTVRVPTGSTTKGASISPDGGTLYIGTEDGFVKIDLSPTNFGVTVRVPTGSTTKGASISPDGGLLVLVTAEGEVLIVDISPAGNDAVTVRVPTGSTTKGASISPDGGLLYLLQEDSDEIVVATLNVTGSFAAHDEVLGGLTVDVTIIGSISVGEDPTALAFDPAQGLVFVANGTQGQLTVLGQLVPTEIGVELRVTPRTLNLQSNGRYVTASIELPSGTLPEDVDLATLRLNDTLEPVAGMETVEDADGDGLLELVVKFDRRDFQATMPHGENVPVTLRGYLVNGITELIGNDAIRTIRPNVTQPRGGENYAPGQDISIQWDSNPLANVGSVNLDASFDGGESWVEVAHGIGDSGQYSWQLPDEPTEAFLVAVTLLDTEGYDLGLAISPGDATILYVPVSARVPQVRAQVEGGDGVLRWELPQALGPVPFHVLASDEATTGYVRITTAPVSGEFVDADLRANRSRWYQLEDAETGLRHGPWKLSRVVANALEQNVPNSFNPRTEIRFSLARPGPAALVVYDMRGRAVRTLVSGELAADNYKVTWDGTDAAGEAVASGIYLYRLTTPGFVATKRMVLVR